MIFIYEGFLPSKRTPNLEPKRGAEQLETHLRGTMTPSYLNDARPPRRRSPSRLGWRRDPPNKVQINLILALQPCCCLVQALINVTLDIGSPVAARGLSF